MLSTLMVVDGIKALSGGHNRCSEPRPSVALHRRRAVISVPHCQRAPPPLPKILSICHISGADWVQGMHFSSINCCVLAWPVSANEGSCVTIHLLQPSQGQLLSFCLRVKKKCLSWHNFNITKPLKTKPTVRLQLLLQSLYVKRNLTSVLSSYWFLALFRKIFAP